MPLFNIDAAIEKIMEDVKPFRFMCCAERFYQYSINYLDSINHWTRWTWIEGIRYQHSTAKQLRRNKK